MVKMYWWYSGRWRCNGVLYQEKPELEFAPRVPLKWVECDPQGDELEPFDLASAPIGEACPPSNE